MDAGKNTDIGPGQPRRGPRRRARMRAALAAGTATAIAAATGVLVLGGSASAASTLRAGTAARGHYVGVSAGQGDPGNSAAASVAGTRSDMVAPSRPPSGRTGSLPGSFRWRSSGILISPHSDSHDIIAVKDPSVVRYRGKWYVYASTVNSSGDYGMEEIQFSNWSQAASATPVYMDQTAIGSGYKTAPQVFYFAPQKLWYLVYQTGDNAGYSTNPDITNPLGWSATRYFYSGMPSIISQNIGSGYWVDMFVNCDRANCYLFSMDDNGHLYRSQTSVADFPNGMSQPVIAASNPTPYNFFEADDVYKIAGQQKYLLIVEAISSSGHRYFTSYTSGRLDGSWTPLAASQSNPFIAASNVSFRGAAWTQDFSSGEMIRANYDQQVTIDPRRMQFLYQGDAPGSYSSYNAIPWRIGMVTQTSSRW